MQAAMFRLHTSGMHHPTNMSVQMNLWRQRWPDLIVSLQYACSSICPPFAETTAACKGDGKLYIYVTLVSQVSQV